MRLFVDAGNSFVKLAFHDGTRWRERWRVPLAEFAAWARGWAAPVPEAVAIANVAGSAFAGPMQDLLKRWQCPVRWVTAKEAQGGVVNGYRRPAELGADRWCALIAAHARAEGPKVVASVGTAVTVDVLTAEGMFEGGVILPGISLMKAALRDNTAGVRVEEGVYELPARGTANAVHTGALLAIARTVDHLASASEGRLGRVKVLLTGGAADAVRPLLGRPVEVLPDLVLEGLLRIVEEEGP